MSHESFEKLTQARQTVEDLEKQASLEAAARTRRQIEGGVDEIKPGILGKALEKLACVLGKSKNAPLAKARKVEQEAEAALTAEAIEFRERYNAALKDMVKALDELVNFYDSKYLETGEGNNLAPLKAAKLELALGERSSIKAEPNGYPEDIALQAALVREESLRDAVAIKLTDLGHLYDTIGENLHLDERIKAYKDILSKYYGDLFLGFVETSVSEYIKEELGKDCDDCTTTRGDYLVADSTERIDPSTGFCNIHRGKQERWTDHLGKVREGSIAFADERNEMQNYFEELRVAIQKYFQNPLHKIAFVLSSESDTDAKLKFFMRMEDKDFGKEKELLQEKIWTAENIERYHKALKTIRTDLVNFIPQLKEGYAERMEAHEETASQSTSQGEENAA